MSTKKPKKIKKQKKPKKKKSIPRLTTASKFLYLGFPDDDDGDML